MVIHITFKQSSCLLFFVGIGMVLLSIFSETWMQNFLLNMGTGILGSLLFLFFIERLIAEQQENQRLKIQLIALEQLRYPLINHFRLLIDMYKASALEAPNQLYPTLDLFFDEKYIDELEDLDLSTDAPVYPPINWYIFLSKEFEDFRNNLGMTVQKYAVSLDPYIIKVIEDIMHSEFMHYCLELHRIDEILKYKGLPVTHYHIGGEAERRNNILKYTSFLLILLGFFQKQVKENFEQDILNHLWEERDTPEYGSSRINH